MSFSGKDISRQRWKYVAFDLISAVISSLLLYLLLHTDTRHKAEADICMLPGGWVSGFTIYIILVGSVYWLSGFYNRPLVKSRLQELIVTIASSFTLTVIISVFPARFIAFPNERILWGGMALTFVILFIPCFLFRSLLTRRSASVAGKEHGEVRCVAIGNSEDIEKGRGWMLDSRNVRQRYRIVGEMSADPVISEAPEGMVNRTLRTFMESYDAECLIIFPGHETSTSLMGLLRECFSEGIPVRIAPDYLSYVTRSIRLRDIYGEPFVDLTSPSMSDFASNLKRLADVVVSVVALISLSPLLLLLAVWVKIDSPGEVIYSQTRLGYHLRPFRIFKFRSMVRGAESETPMLSREGDPRVTRAGRLMRRYRLDELPQFWNVLKGDMSLVGPRPERPYFAEMLMREAPGYFLTSQVKPGLTSWGMVRFGYAGNLEEMKERLRFDLLYLSNMSLFIDMKIIIYTVRIVLTGKGI